MIFYFTATNNCKYVGTRISKELKEEVIPIVECIEKNEFSFKLNSKETVGVVSPTYCWGLPSIVKEFLQKVKFQNVKKDNYFLFLTTYGTTTGQIGKFADDCVKSKGIKFAGKYSVKMPDVWTPTYDLSDPIKVQKINEQAEIEITEVIEKIKKKTSGNFMKDKVPLLPSKMGKLIYEKDRKTKNFHVEDSCISCGRCMKKCPVHAIVIKDGKPVWVKEKCIMCLRCLHHCPTFAIQYGNNTKKHGQYVNPYVKL